MATPADADVGLTGYDYYVPENVVTGEEIAEQSGIPVDVVTEKMGLVEKHVCPPDDDHATDMSVKAARGALDDADIDPAELDLVLYHGSEFKDYVVWSAAANVAERLGTENAYATESYTLCAGAPIALRQVRSQLLAGDIKSALLVTVSREEDLIDYSNQDSSFMFNFGSGAAAAVVERSPDENRTRAWVRESDAITDGSFSEDVVMPAGGSIAPPTHGTVEANQHTLDVPDPDDMKERLGDVSLDNYLSVAESAVEQSGYEMDAIDFVAVTHMKRSFHDILLDQLGLDSDSDGYYLDEYGHMQSVDQYVALEEARQIGRIESGDTVLFLAAGTGYTWSATVLDWLG
jgi:3-oxoacyl-[acyl-carrier-protein] synthase-3